VRHGSARVQLVALGLAVLVTTALLAACGSEHPVAAVRGSLQRETSTKRQEVVLAAGDVHVTYDLKPQAQSSSWQATLTPISGAAVNGPAYRWGPFAGTHAQEDSVSVSLPGGRYELVIAGRQADYSITLAQSD
jgi:hypothetical protein